MNILGVSFLADASAVVLCDGKVASAVSEERLNRVKLWNGVPKLAITKSLKLAGLTLEDIDVVATHGVVASGPDKQAFKEKEATIQKSDLSDGAKKSQLKILWDRFEHERMVYEKRTPDYLKQIKNLGRPVEVIGHHDAHAASAYYASSWDECTVVTCDGWGEDGSASIWQAKSGKLMLVSRTRTIDSLGYFYGSVTKSLGFTPERHEGKILGLAAYCQAPESYGMIRGMIDYDASRKCFIGRMENGLYIPNFDNPALKDYVKEFDREDIAAATQKSLEDVVCMCVADLEQKAKRVAVAGGVFANVKLNQRISELNNVDEVYVFPNMGDGGLSLGAAWQVYFDKTGKKPEPLQTLYLGPSYSDEEIGAALAKTDYEYSLSENIQEEVARLLADNHVVARFQGRMEFGPRALGARSILYAAVDPSVNRWLNEQLNRSEFMPFAPATLTEAVKDLYIGVDKGSQPSKYMAITLDCTDKMKKESPAAVHVDGTARPQVVSLKDYPDFYKIISAYYKLTGKSSVINTSFNIHEEPIVCTIEDALRAFNTGNIPYMAMGNYLIRHRNGC